GASAKSVGATNGGAGSGGYVYVSDNSLSASALMSVSMSAGSPPTLCPEMTAEDGYAEIGCTAGMAVQGTLLECRSCSAGSYSSATSNVCTLCEADTYTALSGQSECTECATGYTSTVGSEECTVIPVTEDAWTIASVLGITNTMLYLSIGVVAMVIVIGCCQICMCMYARCRPGGQGSATRHTDIMEALHNLDNSTGYEPQSQPTRRPTLAPLSEVPYSSHSLPHRPKSLLQPGGYRRSHTMVTMDSGHGYNAGNEGMGRGIHRESNASSGDRRRSSFDESQTESLIGYMSAEGDRGGRRGSMMGVRERERERTGGMQLPAMSRNLPNTPHMDHDRVESSDDSEDPRDRDLEAERQHHLARGTAPNVAQALAADDMGGRLSGLGMEDTGREREDWEDERGRDRGGRRRSKQQAESPLSRSFTGRRSEKQLPDVRDSRDRERERDEEESERRRERRREKRARRAERRDSPKLASSKSHDLL
ncbi:hypothetical protein KIPB_007599, partial [Kipferlia bialata]